jgi:hypothetical protein
VDEATRRDAGTFGPCLPRPEWQRRSDQHKAPGSSTKVKTINAYILTGISKLLATGEAKFDDESGRAVCESMGCFDKTNHSKFVKEKGNVSGGSKGSGWTLTGPGLKSGADLIKALASA